MGVIADHKNKVSLYYHSETALGKQTRAYIESSEKDILTRDLAKENLTGTQWAEIAEGLHKNIDDLIDKEHPKFVEEYGSGDMVMDEHDWIKILDNYPEAMVNPVLMIGSSFHEITTPSDILKYIENDSAGIQERTRK